MKIRQKTLRAAFAALFVLAAGISYAVVGPAHTAATAKAPAVLLPTIVVRPDAPSDRAEATAAVSTAHQGRAAALHL